MLLRTMRLIFISWDTGGKQVRAIQIHSCRVWRPEKTTRKLSAVDLHYIQIMEMFRVGWKNIFVSGTFLWVFHRDDQETDFVYHWILSPNCTTLSLIFLICVQPSFITGNLVYKTPLPSPSITYFQLKCPRPTHACLEVLPATLTTCMPFSMSVLGSMYLRALIPEGLVRKLCVDQWWERLNQVPLETLGHSCLLMPTLIVLLEMFYCHTFKMFTSSLLCLTPFSPPCYLHKQAHEVG